MRHILPSPSVKFSALKPEFSMDFLVFDNNFVATFEEKKTQILSPYVYS